MKSVVQCVHCTDIEWAGEWVMCQFVMSSFPSLALLFSTLKFLLEAKQIFLKNLNVSKIRTHRCKRYSSEL